MSDPIVLNRRSKANAWSTMFEINIDGTVYRGAYEQVDHAVAGALRVHRHRLEAAHYEKHKDKKEIPDPPEMDDVAIVIRRVT